MQCKIITSGQIVFVRVAAPLDVRLKSTKMNSEGCVCVCAILYEAIGKAAVLPQNTQDTINLPQYVPTENCFTSMEFEALCQIKSLGPFLGYFVYFSITIQFLNGTFYFSKSSRIILISRKSLFLSSDSRRQCTTQLHEKVSNFEVRNLMVPLTWLQGLGQIA